MSRKVRWISMALFSCAILAFALFCALVPSHGFEIPVRVSPGTLNIQSQGSVVTVHTGIVFSSVEGGTAKRWDGSSTGACAWEVLPMNR